MAKSKKKNKNSITKQLFGIVLLSISICLCIYIIYTVISLIASPAESFIIQEEVLTEEESTVGYVIREEKVIQSKDFESKIIKLKDEGKKVAKGETIYRYYTKNEEEINAKIQELTAKIQEALQGQTDLFSSDIKSLDNQIQEKLDDLKEINNIQEIKEYKKEIDTYITKKATIAGELSPAGSYINTLIKERTELEQSLYNSTEYVNSDISGVVSYRIDNLENVLTPDSIETLNKKELENLNLKTGQIIASNDNIVKVVNNFECYIAIFSDSEETNKIEEGEKIYIRVAGSEKIKANVEYIKEEGSDKLLVLKINENVENLINYRKISVDIIWWEKEGLKVPKTAVIYENGLSYIVRTKSGSNTKLLIKVEQENDDYCIIRNYKTTELEKMGYTAEEINKIKQVNIYDEILVDPSIEE